MGSGVPHRWKLRPLAFSVPNPSSACIGNHPSRPFPNAPSPIISLSLFFFFYTVNHLIDSYSWAFYCIQLCGSKKMSPSRFAAALHSDRPRTKAKKRSTLPFGPKFPDHHPSFQPFPIPSKHSSAWSYQMFESCEVN